MRRQISLSSEVAPLSNTEVVDKDSDERGGQQSEMKSNQFSEKAVDRLGTDDCDQHCREVADQVNVVINQQSSVQLTPMER